MREASRPSLVALSSRVASREVGLSLLEAAVLLRAPRLRLATISTVSWNAPGNHPRLCGAEAYPETLKAMATEVLADEGPDAALFVGYLRNEAQVRAVEELLLADPSRQLLLDPISGDHGRLYVPQEAAQALASRLAPRATLLMPNLTELAFLLHGDLRKPLNAVELLEEAGERFAEQSLLVTSVPFDREGNVVEQQSARIGVTLIAGGERIAHHTELLAIRPYGTGDLFAGLVLAEFLGRGLSLARAVEVAFHNALVPSLRAWQPGEALGHTLARLAKG